MKIYIPHLHYKINVSFKSKKFLDNLGIQCACEHIKNGEVTIHFKRKPKNTDFPSVAHEVMHVIQRIAHDRGIDMIKEEEHCAYLMHYILNKILGYEFISD
jgi:hypothetical protein